MSTDRFELLILPERSVVRGDEKSETNLLVEIRCKNTVGLPVPPKPLNLCVVIDCSGSMEGQKLEMAKKSCLGIFKQLRGDDFFTVVTFDDEAQVVVNPQVPRGEVEGKIRQVISGGQTNLSLGWYLGLLELQTHATQAYNNRLFLLSDGAANQGETKRAVLAKEAAQSRDRGITTSTIGIGDDFQEDLLDAIATESGGRFWYVQQSKIEDIIDAEFQGALSQVVDRPRVELQLGAGVVISKELNALPKSSGRYRLRPLKGEDLFNFAVRLETTPEQIGADHFVVKAVLYDGDKLLAKAEQLVRLVSRADFVASPTNALVLSVVQQYEITVTNEKMLEKMAAGDLDLMKKMLVTEVGGMRVVRDALTAQQERELDRDRWLIEIDHLAYYLGLKENSITILDMIRDFASTPEVEQFMYRWRKILRQGGQKNAQRAMANDPFDVDALNSLLSGAVELADLLIHRYPDRTASLIPKRELLREQLARHQ